MEWKLDMQEREKRKKNVIIRGLETNQDLSKLKGKVETFLKKLKIKADIQKTKTIGNGDIIQIQYGSRKKTKKI